MRVIFLDIDGVLVYRPYLNAKAWGVHAGAGPDSIAALNRIIEATGAKIVVSSTWRYEGLTFMRDKLAAWGVAGEVIDCTPDCNRWTESGLYIAPTRAEEIAAWLEGREDVDAYVVLDDEHVGGDVIPASRHVLTMFEEGLRDRHADAAIRVLRAPLFAEVAV